MYASLRRLRCQRQEEQLNGCVKRLQLFLLSCSLRHQQRGFGQVSPKKASRRLRLEAMCGGTLLTIVRSWAIYLPLRPQIDKQ